jgi:ABC-2 type transport system permease protein
LRTPATLAAFVRRDWAIARSYRLAYGLELGSILFTLVLFFYLGRFIDASTLAPSSGLKQGYFAFVVIGLALLRVVQVALVSFSNRLRDEQTTGTFEALMAAPASPSLVILGSAAYDLLRALVSSLLMIAVAVALFGMHLESGVGSLAVAVVAFLGCLVLFAILGVVVAAFTVVFKQATPLLRLVTTGMGLLGGVYFPLKVLPGALQTAGQLIPFTWGLDVLRQSLLRGTTDLDRLGFLVAFDVVALPVAVVLFAAALRRARKTGTLAHY